VRQFLPLLLELTPSPHRVSVWDNASRDGSRVALMELARRHPGRLATRFCRGNKSHAGGLQALLDRCDRDLVVFLDCDAVPLRAGWLDELAAPVLAGAPAHGIWFNEYLHPSCLCTRRSTLAAMGVSVWPEYPERDVLQHLTVRAREQGVELARLATDGDYLFDGFGRTYGDGLVYHHWFGTRVNPVAGLEETPEGRTRAGLYDSKAQLERWLRARALWREWREPPPLRSLWMRLEAFVRATS